MVNNTTSGCVNCMVLIRIMVLELLKNNVKLTVKYVASARNRYADLLSRLKYKEFRAMAKEEKKRFNRHSSIPDYLCDISSLLLKI